MVFYRKYRPQKLEELVGQETISANLLSQLTSGKIGHGYLFYGPRGTGKTSTARIFAKAVNCEVYRKQKTINNKQETKYGEPCNKCDSCIAFTDGSSLDLIEIDAASNRGIDEMRDLREKVKLSPVSSPFKVYIIDEVHMLTNEAFNALLKTLEEPPAHAIFILATTDFNKLPPTIVSRLQRFNFKRASKEGITKAISKIAKAESIKLGKNTIEAIVDASDGSYRDAVSLLDQLSSQAAEITEKDVVGLAKVSGFVALSKFVDLLALENLKESVLMVEDIANSGGDISLFIKQTILLLEKVLLFKIGVRDLESLEDNEQVIASLVDKFSQERLQVLIRLLLVSENDIKIYPLPHIPLVLALCKYCGEGREEVSKVTKVSEVSKVSEGTRGPDESKGAKGTEEEEESKEKEKHKASRFEVKDLSEVEKNWGEFLNRVRVVNAHVVALLRATKPSGFDGDNLTLEVFYRFHKDKLEEPKILKMLDSMMEETIGKKVRFRFTLASKGSLPTPVVSKSNVIDVKGEELEKIAQEIFSK